MHVEPGPLHFTDSMTILPKLHLYQLQGSIANMKSTRIAFALVRGMRVNAVLCTEASHAYH